MWSVLESVLCALEKTVYSDALGWNALNISINSSDIVCHLRPLIPCLLFYLKGLSIHVLNIQYVLKSPTMSALLSNSPFMFIVICFICVGAPCVRCTNVYKGYIFVESISLSLYSVFFVSYSLVLKTILFDISIATPAFFSFQFAWNIFSHLFNFSLCVFHSEVCLL